MGFANKMAPGIFEGLLENCYSGVFGITDYRSSFRFKKFKLNNSAPLTVIKFFAMKLHQGSVFIEGKVNSIEVIVRFKTNFVKVIQNHLLFWKPLMRSAN